MTYIPRRDERFEYLWEAAEFVEERQCVSCAFKSDRVDYPMCFEIEAILWAEDPITEWQDLGDEGLNCTKHRDEVLAGNEINQEKLF